MAEGWPDTLRRRGVGGCGMVQQPSTGRMGGGEDPGGNGLGAPTLGGVAWVGGIISEGFLRFPFVPVGVPGYFFVVSTAPPFPSFRRAARLPGRNRAHRGY